MKRKNYKESSAKHWKNAKLLKTMLKLVKMKDKK